MKFLIEATAVSDERLVAMNDEKQASLFGINLVTLTPPSKNCPSCTVPFQGRFNAVSLVVPQTLSAGSQYTPGVPVGADPSGGFSCNPPAVQTKVLTPVTAPPLVYSKATSTSPIECVAGVVVPLMKKLPLFCTTSFLKNQKPRLAVPLKAARSAPK